MKKTPNKTKGFDTDREFTAVLEKIYSEIKVIGEGHNLLKDKLDAAIGMVAKNSEDIAMLDMRVAGLKSEMLAVKEGLNKMNGKLATIETDINVIKTGFNNRLLRLEAVPS